MDREKAGAIAQELIRAAEMFASNNPCLEQGRASWSVWWHQVPEARESFLSAVRQVVDANAGQLSVPDTEHSLTYHHKDGIGLLALALGLPDVNKDKLLEFLIDHIRYLVSMRSTRSLSI